MELSNLFKKMLYHNQVTYILEMQVFSDTKNIN